MKNNIIFGSGISATGVAEYLCTPKRITIFEKKEMVGGRIKSIKTFFGHTEAGAQFFTSEDANVMELITRYGYQSRLTEIFLSDFSIYSDKTIFSLKKNSPENFDREQEAELVKLYEIFGNIGKESFKGQEGELLKTNFERWYRKNIGDKTGFVTNALTRALTFVTPKDLNAYYGILVISTFFNRTFSLKNGLEPFLEEVLRKNNCQINFKSKVENIVFDGDIVDNITINGRVLKTGNSAIFSCIPSTDLSEALPPGKLSKTLSKIRYSSCDVLFINTKEKLIQESSGIIFPSNESDLSIVVEETKKFSQNSKEGFLAVFCPFSRKKSTEFGIIEKLSEIIPNIRESILNTKLFSWNYALPICDTKLLRLQNTINTNTVSNFRICGDFMSLPSLDGAIESGKMAALSKDR